MNFMVLLPWVFLQISTAAFCWFLFRKTWIYLNQKPLSLLGHQCLREGGLSWEVDSLAKNSKNEALGARKPPRLCKREPFFFATSDANTCMSNAFLPGERHTNGKGLWNFWQRCVTWLLFFSRDALGGRLFGLGGVLLKDTTGWDTSETTSKSTENQEMTHSWVRYLGSNQEKSPWDSGTEDIVPNMITVTRLKLGLWSQARASQPWTEVNAAISACANGIKTLGFCNSCWQVCYWQVVWKVPNFAVVSNDWQRRTNYFMC